MGSLLLYIFWLVIGVIIVSDMGLLGYAACVIIMLIWPATARIMIPVMIVSFIVNANAQEA